MHKNMTILIAWASGLEQFESLGADLCDGVYFGAQYWHTADAHKTWIWSSAARTSSRPTPTTALAGSYICTKLLIDAIVKAGSVEQRPSSPHSKA